ncbi:GlxA family transcriptional regulator [Nonomuraea sp. SBT364]|uniref:GlxA family transcriptional regulator n=1 Tax=Nonomuraea sp. SBT364 TaxID=1580530 RepID=UPI00066CAEA1|nr:helix-turn-helix domain-containing protein [Nonomuraea sp. SBT364]
MRSVALLLHDEMSVLDYSVVCWVWGADRSHAGVPRFDLRLCSIDGAPVTMEPAALVRPTHTLDGLDDADLIVIPGAGIPREPLDGRLVEALHAAAGRGAEIAALCSGAFVLAAAGLLDGRRATTHWLLTAQLAEAHPGITVDPGALFVADGGIWTSAGATAGIDLCLHLVRLAHGVNVANVIARHLVAAGHRDGGQAQFVARPVPATNSAAPDIAATQAWALDRLDQPLTVAELAAHARTSPRTFARHFADYTGTTPAQWLLRARIARAQQLLESTTLPIDQVAARCGFGVTALLRRHFSRLIGTSPGRYRRLHGH